MKLGLIIASIVLNKHRGDRRDLESGTAELVEKEAKNGENGQARGFREEDDDDGGDGDGELRIESPNGSRVAIAVGASTSKRNAGRPSWWAQTCHYLKRIKDFVLQDDGSDDQDDGSNHRHRLLPILSGIIIPFSILLEIPGLTEHWYIVTQNNKTIETRPNPPLLDVGLSISMAMAVIANIAIIFRFMEKKVRTSTLVAIAALTIHDIINIVAVTVFGVIHRFNDGFTYGQSFWFTVCATIASTITNVTLVIDYVRTPDFARSSSGLTRKQRSLIIVVMLLMFWIAVGALVNSLLIGLSFIDGMYFTVVTIETIGFGDIYPHTTGARIFVGFHSTIGVLNLALAVTICNDTIIEAFEESYRKHILAIGEAHHMRKINRRVKRVKEEAMKRQLEKAGLPVYKRLHVRPGGGRSGGHGTDLNKTSTLISMHKLNVEALTPDQHAEAMQEAEEVMRNEREGLNLQRRSTIASSFSVDASLVAEGLQKEFTVKLTVVWTLFLTFWLIGAAIFMAAEKWSYGDALWFCFESFSTIGYGDRTPDTPAGRAVFIVWAMLGVGTMTTLISVLSEAFSSRYEQAMRHVVRHNDPTKAGAEDHTEIQQIKRDIKEEIGQDDERDVLLNELERRRRRALKEAGGALGDDVDVDAEDDEGEETESERDKNASLYKAYVGAKKLGRKHASMPDLHHRSGRAVKEVDVGGTMVPFYIGSRPDSAEDRSSISSSTSYGSGSGVNGREAMNQGSDSSVGREAGGPSRTCEPTRRDFIGVPPKS